MKTGKIKKSRQFFSKLSKLRQYLSPVVVDLKCFLLLTGQKQIVPSSGKVHVSNN